MGKEEPFAVRRCKRKRHLRRPLRPKLVPLKRNPPKRRKKSLEKKRMREMKRDMRGKMKIGEIEEMKREIEEKEKEMMIGEREEIEEMMRKLANGKTEMIGKKEERRRIRRKRKRRTMRRRPRRQSMPGSWSLTATATTLYHGKCSWSVLKYEVSNVPKPSGNNSNGSGFHPKPGLESHVFFFPSMVTTAWARTRSWGARSESIAGFRCNTLNDLTKLEANKADEERAEGHAKKDKVRAVNKMWSLCFIPVNFIVTSHLLIRKFMFPSFTKWLGLVWCLKKKNSDHHIKGCMKSIEKRSSIAKSPEVPLQDFMGIRISSQLCTILLLSPTSSG